MRIERQLTTMEEEIMVNPQYVQKQSGHQDDDSAPSATPQASSQP